MEWIILALVGFIAAIVGSLLGLGGGILIVPALLLIDQLSVEMTPQLAVGTSLLIMIFTGLSSTIAYKAQGKVDIRSGLLFFIGSGPGAIAGVLINRRLDIDGFFLAFGIFIIALSIILTFKDKVKPLPIRQERIKLHVDDTGVTHQYGLTPSIAIVLSFFVGMLSGLFGVGGGSIMVPAMILLFAFPPHLAVGTSMFLVFLSALTSATSHVLLEQIVYLYALVLIPTAWIGAKVGAAINRRMNSVLLVRIFQLFLLIIGLRMIANGF
ncbi:sulfite exporter TauE/SafE family protein [Paenalkalicoccus suaedae]|uniref:Probable membrane transporter protein n=1 Tax=Paenalkalicoccus suaedae TaxID=2592382 RepID=A0A859FHT5_9BACI|nr:sulfite exporter TauE/SafE family protein [Paenalkalicoccus suaedae]QKS72202.1 sulfite exporter TauE/SafE family protein [Paenalkalicoccus suaedae]